MNANRKLTVPIALASAAACAAISIPALAAAPADSAPQPDEGRLEAGSAPLTDLRAAEARAERRERRRRRSGPVHPVVGKPDYGTAENGFGVPRSGHVHSGQDVFAPAGTPLVAAVGGVVVEAGSDGGRGNFVSIHDRERDLTLSYFHMLSAAEVRAGQDVEAGSKVGEVGCTGSCWGDHLHFELRRGRDPYGEAIDPMAFLRAAKTLERPR